MANRRSVIAALVLISVASLSLPSLATDDDAQPLGLKGYDVVSYFQLGKAQLGTRQFQMEYDGRRYQFLNAQHKATFVGDPEHYLPQFAGFCAAGVSKGKKVVADPTAWRIIDGKLYVFSSAKALEMLDKDPDLLNRSKESWNSMK